MRPSHHANDTKTLFQNPWGIPTQGREWPNLQNFSIQNFPLEWAKQHPDHPHKPITVIRPDFSRPRKPNTLRATWLGHASFFLEFLSSSSSSNKQAGRILFDPLFSERVGPHPWTGIRRRLPAPCTVDDLPEFEYVVISHNHYDHLDTSSIESIIRARGSKVHYMVPLGNKPWFVATGVAEDQITEMDWWQGVTFPGPTTPNGESEMKFICAPAQHVSGRGVMDVRTTLWASWLIEQNIPATKSAPAQRIVAYHAGDTGYQTNRGPCPIFKEIGEKYGPIDFAMLPIWRGATLSFIARMGLRLADQAFLSPLHATPSEALAIHREIRSRHTLGMHFATFAGSDIEAFDPIVEMTKEREELGIRDWNEEWGFGVVDIGEVTEVPIDTEWPALPSGTTSE